MGHPNDALTGMIVSTYIAGEAVGSVLQMILGDRLGRKRFMQLMCLIVSACLVDNNLNLIDIQVTVGTVIQTAAQSYAMFVVGRILTGVAV